MSKTFSRTDTITRLLMREKGQQLVINELRHRTKNLLSVVLAIARQTGYVSHDVESFQCEFSQRLNGLSRSMDLLVEDGGGGAAVSGLVHSQLQPFGNIDGVRISATGPDLFLNLSATQNLGLALHELATNALKYGALSVPEGTVTVAWQVGPGPLGSTCFRLTWREQNGPEVKPPEHAGFGQVVLQRMTGATLGGSVSHEFHPSGVVWTLEVFSDAVLIPSTDASVVGTT
ncbi:sensor histidine kinase [Hyphomicrobium sp. LHD-15]|uniref:sensor histidine kinase n=1 Tax=Hyphomicrobium sp. LHD-15 TaxID=3072142 RepID=UPI00280F26C5|nr:sensor histidine kinase [Hyphomicrobium sp. LHD-15]MDQ8698144.1 sensor histidine kinase [Hyphomicrobium sp. LHD-15]